MPKTRIAITYNEKVGGSSVISLKNSIKELDSEVVDADYRRIVSDLPDLEDIYINKEKRSELFQQAKRRAILFLKDIDGLILSGNLAMVDPRLYSENLDRQKIDLARNIAEAALIHVAIQKGIPLLGICGGHQMINVYFGGSLKTLSPESIGKQKFMDYSSVQIDAQSELGQILSQGGTIPQSEGSIIESFFGAHNQAVKGLGGKGLINGGDDDYLQCSAVAADDDGSVEGMESKYGSPLMGLQFHPEVGVKGLPKKAFIFQAPTESEVLKNKRILEAFNQAAETYRHKRMLVQQIPLLRGVNAVNPEGAVRKPSSALTSKDTTRKSLKKQKNVFSKMIVFLYKKIGNIIRKVLSYKLTNKKSKLLRKKQLKKSHSLPKENDTRASFVLQQDFLDVATKENRQKNKVGKNRKLKPLKRSNLRNAPLSNKKHNRGKSKKRSYNGSSFFKKSRRIPSAISKSRLNHSARFSSVIENPKQCFNQR